MRRKPTPEHRPGRLPYSSIPGPGSLRFTDLSGNQCMLRGAPRRLETQGRYGHQVEYKERIQEVPLVSSLDARVASNSKLSSTRPSPARPNAAGSGPNSHNPGHPRCLRTCGPRVGLEHRGPTQSGGSKGGRRLQKAR